MRRVLITGVRGGIGTALAGAFADAGYRVIGLDLAGVSVNRCERFLEIDLARLVSDDKFRAGAMDRIKAAIEGGGLHALINNAATQCVRPFHETSIEDWRNTIDVNVLAPILLIRELLPALEAVGGAVVNISSIHAQLTKPEFVAYATSKAALSGLTQALAVECGNKVRVNAIEPAAIDTEMLRDGFGSEAARLEALEDYHPIGRLGKPEEVASLCLYLCSDDAGFVNGARIGLDGGILRRLHDPG